MKKVLFVITSIIALSAALPATAQDVFYSGEQKFTYQNGDFSVMGWCGYLLYTYWASMDGNYLYAYNDSMRLLATIALDFFPQKIHETRFIVSGDRIIVLYQAEQENQIMQYAAMLDDKARLIQRPKVLDAVKSGWLATDRKYYSSVANSDRSRIMIYSVGNKKDRNTQFKTILIDSSLNVLRKGNSTLNGDDITTLDQSLLAGDGTFYLAGYSGAGSKQYSGDARLFRLPPDTMRFETITIPLEENFISGMHIKLDELNNAVYISGFYSSKKNGNVEGLIYGLYNPASAGLTTLKAIPFDEDLRAGADDKNKKRAFNDFTVRDIIVKNDGGFILIAENYFITTRTTSYGSGFGYYSWYYNGPYGGSYVREFHYGDIVVLNYSESGELLWRNFIRKNQYSQEDGGLFSSYTMLNSGASLVFLYNDFSSSRSSLSLAAIDGSGVLQMKKMDQGRAVNGDWLPRSGKQIDIQELLVPVLKKNSLWFARVAF